MLTSRKLLAALAVFALAAVTTAAPPSDDELKEAALKLNDIHDPKAMQEKLTELLKDKAATKQLVRVAAKLRKDAGDKQPAFKFNAAIVLAKAAHNVKEYDAAEGFYDTAVTASTKLKNSAKMIQAYEGLMDLYWDQKKYQGVEEAAERFLDAQGDQTNFATLLIMERMAQAKAKRGDTEDALKVVDRLQSLPKIGSYFLQTKGWVQREAGKYKESAEAYEDFLKKIDDLKELGFDDDERKNMAKNTRYLLTGVYVDDKNVDKAADLLKGLMKDDPDNPTFYNDLGFIWADNDKNLEESEKLIRKALELDTKQRKKLLADGKIDEKTATEENAAYLDSLGWVLFKNKKYAEAVKYLEAASKDEEEGNHLEIWDHLGDALMALGKKKEAADVWQKALKLEDISKRDADRRKKVTAKLRKVKEELAK